MALGKSVGSKIDRGGSTFAARHDAIKQASRMARRSAENGEIVEKAADARASRLSQKEKDRRKS